MSDHSGGDKPNPLLPLRLEVRPPPYLFDGAPFDLTLHSGLTVLIGPNGSGKTQTLRSLRSTVETRLAGIRRGDISLRTRFLAAGRSSPLELFRGVMDNPAITRGAAAIGHSTFQKERHKIESVIGDMLALDDRADLRIKIEGRLQGLFRQRLKLRWVQNGLEVAFVSGNQEYKANTEASGVLQLIGLLAAIHDDDVGSLLIDEPEISLHPQMQAFLLDEILSVAGDPGSNPRKKIIIISNSRAEHASASPYRRNA